MPIGVIADAAAVLLGGLCGAWIAGKLKDGFQEQLNLVFGGCSMAMGIGSIVLMEQMPAVVLSIILGSILGLALQLGRRIDTLAIRLLRAEDDRSAQLVTAVVLFCASGTGIYGSLLAGFNGDHSVLLAKTILDFFTAIIFACSLGAVVSLIALPQFVIFLALFLLAGVIYPLTTPVMINDFKACGGIIMLLTGIRMANIKRFPIADMIPAMALVMPISALWSALLTFLG